MYKGKINYETYCAVTWLHATECDCEYIYAEYDRLLAAFDGDKLAAVQGLAMLIEERVITESPQGLGDGLYSELLGAAIGNICWLEVAASFAN